MVVQEVRRATVKAKSAIGRSFFITRNDFISVPLEPWQSRFDAVYFLKNPLRPQH
jgi:hypothetical protein